jgi:hypothetical protein
MREAVEISRSDQSRIAEAKAAYRASLGEGHYWMRAPVTPTPPSRPYRGDDHEHLEILIAAREVGLQRGRV